MEPMDRDVLWPMLAMAGLSFAVTVAMFRRRVAEIRRRRIPLRELATSRGIALLEDSAAADNYRNLFEMPVLFYAACLLVAAARLDSPALPVLAWAYVAARLAHSAIQLGANRVRWRFMAFAASAAHPAPAASAVRPSDPGPRHRSGGLPGRDRRGARAT